MNRIQQSIELAPLRLKPTSGRRLPKEAAPDGGLAGDQAGFTFAFAGRLDATAAFLAAIGYPRLGQAVGAGRDRAPAPARNDRVPGEASSAGDPDGSDGEPEPLAPAADSGAGGDGQPRAATRSDRSRWLEHLAR
jgi:hypothetical protein